jgi:hypothetical protein
MIPAGGFPRVGGGVDEEAIEIALKIEEIDGLVRRDRDRWGTGCGFFYRCRGRDRSDTILCERYLCLGIGYMLYSSPTDYNWYRFDYRDMRSRGIKEIRFMPYKFGIFGFTII